MRNAADALVALHGPDALERAFQRIPNELVALFLQKRLLGGNWYPIAFMAALLRGIDETTPGGRELMRKLGKLTMKNDLSGVYRAFAKLFGPDRSLQVSTRLYKLYFDTGQAEIVESRSGFALARWSGCTGFGPRMFQLMIGSCEALLECVGAEHVRTHVRAGADEGDEFCDLAAYWT